jgi:chromosome partitioning protein
MATTICFSSKKGGVSKTSSAIILGLILSQSKRVLIIDSDSQNALTSFFFEDINEFHKKTIWDAIKGEKLLSQVIFKKTSQLSIIPCDDSYEQVNLWNRIGKEVVLKKLLNQVKDEFDYIIIDTAPNLYSETIMGLVAANIVIIPAKLEKMDTRAINYTLSKINLEIREDLNPDLHKIFILPTQYSYQNRTVHDLCLEQLKESYPKMIVPVTIPYSSKISQFNFIGFDNDFHSLKEFQEYEKLAEYIIHESEK